MYVPNSNREEDPARIIAFMREYSFATLVTSCQGRLQATHLPFVINEAGTGLVLGAHVARANPQWRDFAGASEVLAVFQEPHAYISPSHYERALSVPTWNYVAVHAYGPVTVVEEPGPKRALLLKLIRLHDQDYVAQFEKLPDDYLAGMLGGIVAFEIAVTRLEARFKLSQERTPSERDHIVEALTASPISTTAQIGVFMREQGAEAEQKRRGKEEKRRAETPPAG